MRCTWFLPTKQSPQNKVAAVLPPMSSDDDELSPALLFTRSVRRTGRKAALESPVDRENITSQAQAHTVVQQQCCSAYGFVRQELTVHSPDPECSTGKNQAHSSAILEAAAANSGAYGTSATAQQLQLQLPPSASDSPAQFGRFQQLLESIGNAGIGTDTGSSACATPSGRSLCSEALDPTTSNDVEAGWSQDVTAEAVSPAAIEQLEATTPCNPVEGPLDLQDPYTPWLRTGTKTQLKTPWHAPDCPADGDHGQCNLFGSSLSLSNSSCSLGSSCSSISSRKQSPCLSNAAVAAAAEQPSATPTVLAPESSSTPEAAVVAEDMTSSHDVMEYCISSTTAMSAAAATRRSPSPVAGSSQHAALVAATAAPAMALHELAVQVTTSIESYRGSSGRSSPAAAPTQLPGTRDKTADRGVEGDEDDNVLLTFTRHTPRRPFRGRRPVTAWRTSDSDSGSDSGSNSSEGSSSSSGRSGGGNIMAGDDGGESSSDGDSAASSSSRQQASSSKDAAGSWACGGSHHRRITPGSSSSLVARRRPRSSWQQQQLEGTQTEWAAGYTGPYDFDLHMDPGPQPGWPHKQQRAVASTAAPAAGAISRLAISPSSSCSMSPRTPVAALTFTPKAAMGNAAVPASGARRLSQHFLISTPMLKPQAMQATPSGVHTLSTVTGAGARAAAAEGVVASGRAVGGGLLRPAGASTLQGSDWQHPAGTAGAAATPGHSSRGRPGQAAGGAGCMTAPAKAPSSRTFARQRQQLAQQLYAQWNVQVFDGGLPTELPLVWNPRLTATAGQVVDDGSANSMKTSRDERVPVRLELSSKVLDTESRLRSTLAHEMCHVAAWAISREFKQHHGPAFWAWARRFEARVPGIKITTCHNYDVHAPFRWQCSNHSCGKQYHRHKRSIDTNKHVCSRCNGRLLYLGKFSRDGRLLTGASTTPAAAGPGATPGGGGGNAFSQYVKSHFAEVKRCLPAGTPHKEVMGRLAAQYKQQKAASAVSAATAPGSPASHAAAPAAAAAAAAVVGTAAGQQQEDQANTAAPAGSDAKSPSLAASPARSGSSSWQSAEEAGDDQLSSLLPFMDRLALS